MSFNDNNVKEDMVISLLKKLALLSYKNIGKVVWLPSNTYFELSKQDDNCYELSYGNETGGTDSGTIDFEFSFENGDIVVSNVYVYANSADESQVYIKKYCVDERMELIDQGFDMSKLYYIASGNEKSNYYILEKEQQLLKENFDEFYCDDNVISDDNSCYMLRPESLIRNNMNCLLVIGDAICDFMNGESFNSSTLLGFDNVISRGLVLPHNNFLMRVKNDNK